MRGLSPWRSKKTFRIMQESLKIWEGLADELGEDVGFARGGCTFTAKTDREMSELAAWVVIAKQYDIDTRLIDGDELQKS
ncbi:MAG: FAD-dependent oxidoreductase [Pseudomonadales bacterium]|nr:FAD-dependent oxidoreductase [Pseudomonadales bacterium]